jgi:glutathionylspermidine synthase
VSVPWITVNPLSPDAMAGVRQRTIFDCCKWDPQIEDVSVLCNFPLVLKRSEWQTLSALARQLAVEARAAEQELLGRPKLHGQLGLTPAVRRALRQSAENPPAEGPRLMRFDFHWTTDGWRISEANADVAGGLIESSGFARNVANFYPTLELTGNPAAAYAAAAARMVPRGVVALVHATSYADDRGVMTYLSRIFAEHGFTCVLASPADLRWTKGRARLYTGSFRGRIDLIVRFFPAEWLPNLPAASGWRHFFHHSQTRLSNPATAMVVQSKRFPIVWSSLKTPLPVWQRLLPETCDPRQVDWKNDAQWVLKPAVGREGEDVVLHGLVEEDQWTRIRRDVRRHPGRWAAQRRFEAVPLVTPHGTFFPQAGVYTVESEPVGIYGRLAARPLIDGRALDAAVLVGDETSVALSVAEGKRG